YELFLLIFHGITTLVLMLAGARLCQKCQHSTTSLRIKESIIFGVPSLYFIAMQWLVIIGHVPILTGITAPWMLLVLVYSLYIPNTWRRAAWVLGTFAIAPVVLCIVADMYVAGYDKTATTSNIATVFMTMALASSIGTWGVHTINRLRREAFEAKQLGQYKLKRLLGAGGMGEVHLAEHQLMKRPVAIKLIKPSKAADPQALARFHREVQATAKLTHWNSIEIFDYGHTDDGTFYYVMEYLPGKSLADLVDKHGPLAPERVVFLLEQICEALGEAHELGLIHRDIKPGNIFAAERGGVYDVAKLLDFGLAKPAISNGDVSLTQEGTITGSPLFMAPEQATGDSMPDGRSDIYALGAVAYYLLTGHAPFEAENPVKVIIAHAQKPVVPPSQLQPGIPADVERIVMKCLEKKPDDRFADVWDLSAALAATTSHGRWTRTDAKNWWHTNGDVDRNPIHSGAANGAVRDEAATDRADDDATIDSGSGTQAGVKKAILAGANGGTKGGSDATRTNLPHDSASVGGALVGR
ncbi:MAG TPA: serine/threonine-protein kinase, partial [Pirellulales bacterium]